VYTVRTRPWPAVHTDRRHVQGRLPCTRPSVYSAHGPVYGPCTRPCPGRAHDGCVYSSCTGCAVCTRRCLRPGPCTRPYIIRTRPCTLVVNTNRIDGRVHGRVYGPCTWPLDGYAHGPIHGRVRAINTAVFAARVHGSVRTMNTAVHGPAPSERSTTAPSFRPMSILAKQSPISDTAEHLYINGRLKIISSGQHSAGFGVLDIGLHFTSRSNTRVQY